MTTNQLVRFSDPRPVKQVPLSSSLQALLSKEVREPLSILGIDGIIPNRDPILRFVAPAAGSRHTDERVWVEMEKSEHKLSDARRHLESDIFADEFHIQAGGKTPAAVVLQDFAKFLWARVPDSRTVLKRCLDSYFWGWRPLQILPKLQTYLGQEVWLPEHIIDKPAHRVRFTEKKELVWLPEHFGFGGPGSGARIFSEEQRQLGWLTPKVGTLDTPYGSGLYSLAFLLIYAKKQIFKQFAVGFERSTGLMKVSTEQGGADIGDAINAVRTQLEQSLEILNAHNIVLEWGNWTVDFLTDLEFVDGGLRTLEYFDSLIMCFFVGETLTSNISSGSTGSFAAAKVHRAVKTSYARDAVSDSVEAPINQLLRNYIVANFGEVDEEDLPTLQCAIKRQIDPDNVKLYIELGGSLDAGAVAERLGLSDVIAEGTEDDVLFKETPTSIPFNESEEEEEDTEVDEGSDTTRAKTIKRQKVKTFSEVDALLEQSRQRAGPSLDRLTKSLGEDFLQQKGIDPKALTPPN